MTRPASDYLGGGIRIPIQPAQRVDLVPFTATVTRTPKRILGDVAGRQGATIVPGGPCSLVISSDNDTNRGQLVPDQGTTVHHSGEVWAWSTGGPNQTPWGDFEAATDNHATNDVLNILGPTEGTISLAKVSSGDLVAGGVQALKYTCAAGVTAGQAHTILLSSAVSVGVDDEVLVEFDYRVTGSVTASFSLVMIPTTGSTYPRRTIDALNSSPVGSQPFRHASLTGKCSTSVSAVISAVGDMQFTPPDAGSVWQPVIIITLTPYANAGVLILDNFAVRPTTCLVTGTETRG